MSQNISGNFDAAPEALLVERLSLAGKNLKYSDLGAKFREDF
jgi:hypothetical protein